MIIVKIGGGADINLIGIVAGLAEINDQLIIVHGANALRDQLARELGYEKKVLTSISGYSSVFSDEKTIDLQMMAYAGLRNKRIVELCHQQGINAIGLSGIDGKLIQGRRNPGIRIQEGGKRKIVRDFSGKPMAINKQLLGMLLDSHYVPVLSVPIIDENSQAINSENDDIVAVLHREFFADTIIQLIEAAGFLDDEDDPSSVVRQLPYEMLVQKEASATGRIKRKLYALKKLLETARTTVIIADGRVQRPIHDALNGGGTIVK